MKQMTLAAVGFERDGKTTRRAVFLAEMDRVVPWRELCMVIEPGLSEAGQRSSSGGVGADAAHLLASAVVRPVGPFGRGGALRLDCDAQVRWHRSGSRAGARRDHGLPLPPSARSA